MFEVVETVVNDVVVSVGVIVIVVIVSGGAVAGVIEVDIVDGDVAVEEVENVRHGRAEQDAQAPQVDVAA